MACVEVECFVCGYFNITNKVPKSCPQCGSRLKKLFDEFEDHYDHDDDYGDDYDGDYDEEEF